MNYTVSFNNMCSPMSNYMASFHDHAMVIIVMILSLVMYLFAVILVFPCVNRSFLGSEMLELVWTILPGVVLAFLAVPSLSTLYLTDEVTNPHLNLKAIGHQWFWSYEYSDFEGLEFDSYMVPVDDLEEWNLRLLTVDNNTVVPSMCEMRMVTTSMDVIHSWTVPSLGVKVDSVPGRLNQACLFVVRSGLSYGQCSEICGAFHSFMPIVLESVPVNHFIDWLKS
uniref:cytochrome c oxidase subunit II n=1 Tax=Docophoroides brevis TaxID=160119 RepID=UPI00211EA559|nr:cytochrome c oxidase subunit II [Docophoroides brevis]UTT72593.1 cytochrome c oxidase subunit 2 [Docophoroides brevis]